jgi:hypothetical protein
LSNNSLVVKTYEVYGMPTKMGAVIDVSYAPHAGDPTTNIHWIQVVTDNDPIGGQFGQNESIVDTSDGKTDPYFTAKASGQSGFYDNAARTDTQNAVTWQGEAYLIQQTGTKAARLYGGISWGWFNSPLPPPGP